MLDLRASCLCVCVCSHGTSWYGTVRYNIRFHHGTVRYGTISDFLVRCSVVPHMHGWPAFNDLTHAGGLGVPMSSVQSVVPTLPCRPLALTGRLHVQHRMAPPPFGTRTGGSRWPSPPPPQCCASPSPLACPRHHISHGRALGLMCIVDGQSHVSRAAPSLLEHASRLAAVQPRLSTSACLGSSCQRGWPSLRNGAPRARGSNIILTSH